jgi:hypothetical protein
MMKMAIQTLWLYQDQAQRSLSKCFDKNLHSAFPIPNSAIVTLRSSIGFDCPYALCHLLFASFVAFRLPLYN